MPIDQKKKARGTRFEHMMEEETDRLTRKDCRTTRLYLEESQLPIVLGADIIFIAPEDLRDPSNLPSVPAMLDSVENGVVAQGGKLRLGKRWKTLGQDVQTCPGCLLVCFQADH